MHNKRIRILIAIAAICLIAGLFVCDAILRSVGKDTTSYLYIDQDDDIDSVKAKIADNTSWVNRPAFNLMSHHFNYADAIRTGRYEISPEVTTLRLFHILLRHQTVPAKVVVPSVRTLQDLAANLSGQLMADSVSLINAFTDSATCKTIGFTPETMPALFIPDTYEFYWDSSTDQILQRFLYVNHEFWNTERRNKANRTGLSQTEVVTLASIVDSETNNSAEKARIAGLYINRLHLGMPLQSDPTVIFAWQDFSIRRVMKNHLAIDSPYNTYKNVGLPPGPIRIPTIEGIDAVLDYEHHDYIYMCAKEDFSGSHNFATTLKDHSRNAHRYQQALAHLTPNS